MKEFIYLEEESMRLDVFLSQQIESLSREVIKNLITSKDVLVNGEKKKPSYKLLLDDKIVVNMPEIKEVQIKPIDYPIEIVYEDDYLLVVNKPAGLVVYPGSGQESESLVAALMGQNIKLAKVDNIRDGIVHRLDKDTSGLMVVAKDKKTFDLLSEMFKERTITRKYYTLVNGNLDYDYGTIDAPIGKDKQNFSKQAIVGDGKSAITYFTVLERFKDYNLLECELVSGRTHQIRVHLQYIKHPIIGDTLYGNNKYKVKYQLLQSYFLQFEHPITKELKKIEIPLRDDIKEFLEE